MVQGEQKANGGNKNINSNKRSKRKPAPKRKVGTNDDTREKDEISKTIGKKIKEHQKKIYKSIESAIIDKAKTQYREKFKII
jgi:hypothetical protein